MAGTGQRVTVRDAAQDDLAAVGRIFAHYVVSGATTFAEQAPSAADWQERLAGVGGAGLPFLVAESGRELLGYSYCRPWKPASAYRYTVEDSVYVSPDAVGRGIGRALLEGLLGRCADAGVREVVAVIADTGQPGSIALHRRCGFVEAGRLTRVGFKHGRWWDTLLWQRSLP